MPYKILISPYSRKLRNGNQNPKVYPWWNQLLKTIKKSSKFPPRIIQIGITGEEKLPASDEFILNPSLKEIAALAKSCTTWISIDNFLPHLCNSIKKSGIVIFGQSDPLIFGYPDNLNILKNRSFLREHQFDMWESCQYREDCFLAPKDILKLILGKNK